MIVLGFSDYEIQSRNLAEALNISVKIIQQHRFPDGESKLTLPRTLPEQVIFCRSLNQPNDKLIELLLAARTARELGATQLTLVAPYLCYMRQDIAFHQGEVVSQKVIGRFLADLFDTVITVDPHLHRIDKLEQAIPATNAISLNATSLMSEFLKKQFNEPILIGPDKESDQWVNAIAKPNQWDYGVCSKIRKGDTDVEVTLPDINLQGRTVVLVDDVASSGKTLLSACLGCLEKGAKQVDVLVTHALFVNDAIHELKQAGVSNIWSTDSVSHDTNVLKLSGLLKDAILNLE